MENAEFSYQVSSFFNQFLDDLQNMVDNLNWSTDSIDLLAGEKTHYKNVMLSLIMGDYISGKSPEGMFGQKLSELKNNSEEFKSILPILPELKSNFMHEIEEIQDISQKYIRQYESNYKGFLETLIKEEIMKHEFAIIDANDFLKTNQYKKLYDICCSVKGCIFQYNQGEITSRNRGLKSRLDPNSLEVLYNLMIENGYIQCDLKDFNAALTDEPLPNNFEPIVWIKKSSRNKTVNKFSLIDFLRLTSSEEIEIPHINILFAASNGVSIKITKANIYNNKSNEHSEYFDELKSILQSVTK